MWFLVTWVEKDEDGEELTDILAGRKLVGDIDVDTVEIGSFQNFIFGSKNTSYEAEIKGRG